MSTKTIYTQLVQAGMSPAGACGLMGNMQAESAMRSNNAQDGMTKLTDVEYTARVDNGSYKDFAHDAVGYGLCQWTYWSRKQELFNFAKVKGVSVSDEAMQVDFAVRELKTGYAGLWSFLCTTSDIEEAASRICKEYERPAVNNISVRAAAALKFYKELAGETKQPTTSHPEEVEDVKVNTLKKGDTGAQVKALQALLIGYGGEPAKLVRDAGGVDGSFGPGTEKAVLAYKKTRGLTGGSDVGPTTWSHLLGTV